jgi:hypothetical protein
MESLAPFCFDTGQCVSSFTTRFCGEDRMPPVGRISGFRMSGERLGHKHCDHITFDLSGQKLLALLSAPLTS